MLSLTFINEFDNGIKTFIFDYLIYTMQMHIPFNFFGKNDILLVGHIKNKDDDIVNYNLMIFYPQDNYLGAIRKPKARRLTYAPTRCLDQSVSSNLSTALELSPAVTPQDTEPVTQEQDDSALVDKSLQLSKDVPSSLEKWEESVTVRYDYRFAIILLTFVEVKRMIF